MEDFRALNPSNLAVGIGPLNSPIWTLKASNLAMQTIWHQGEARPVLEFWLSCLQCHIATPLIFHELVCILEP